MRWILRPPALAVALAAAACAPLSQLTFERPAVQLAAVDVTGLGLQGGALDLLLDVHNPNAYDLRTTRMAVGVRLEDTHFGDVALEQATVLPSRQTTRLVVPLAFTWSGVGAGARALLARGAVRYRLDGRLEVDTPVGARGVDLALNGDVTLRDLVGR